MHGKLPYEKLIHKDEALRKMLLILPFPKYIFTNADIKHAERCLGLLGIRDCFKVPVLTRLLAIPLLLLFTARIISS